MRRLGGALLVLLAISATGCGKERPGSGDGAPAAPKRGGELTILSAGDVTSLDPGAWFYGYDHQALGPTQRALYGWRPGDTRPTPDLATALPQTSAGGTAVTITLRQDVRFSPPLQDRTVTSADVKYAIERTFRAAVAGPYARVYFDAIIGSGAFRTGAADAIKGIETPDTATLVLRLRHPVGAISSGQALSLYATAPVPQDYARRYDARRPSTYGAHQVFTGPYMIENDGKGTVTGYEPGRRLRLVRNPSWDPKTDRRPAYLDAMTLRAGGDIDADSRRILSSKRLVSGDVATPPINVLRSALDTREDQLEIVPSQGVRFVALNTTVKPFDREFVRRAVAAALDRRALRATRGGPPLGRIATHFLASDVPGFDAAGGRAGVADFLLKAGGDLKLARSYLRRAGYRSGRYAGPPLLMVAEDRPPGSATAAAVRAQLGRLGFRFMLRSMSRSDSFRRGCGAPSARVAICPNGAWSRDLLDAQPLLEPVFDGERIAASGSANWSQIDDAELNAGFDLADAETDPDRRADAYADIDRQVTRHAYVVPWLWDNQINTRSADVRGVVNRFTSSWDLAYTSLR